ncbi:MAG: phosphatase PAP2 family protein [Methylomicrobium sp.]|nr:phosphatase PAP2 family protein [Methylomicrobium sp.]
MTISSLLRCCLRALRRQYPIIAIILAYITLAALLAWLFGHTDRFSLHIYTDTYGVLIHLFSVVVVLGHVIYIMIWVRPDRLTLYILSSWKRFLIGSDRFLQGIILMLLLPLFMSSFTFMKAMIPVLMPYTWDPLLVYWDRWLHGGTEPWRLLAPLLHRPWLTSAINFAYNLWFFIMYGVFCWQAFDQRRPDLRMRYLLSFFLNWALIGTFAATLFSSVGPVYYHLVYGEPSPFAPLTAYLKEVSAIMPVWAVDVQEQLWADYRSNTVGLGSGISAMPSMHLASTFLMTLLAFEYSRIAGWIAVFYTFVIFIGSIHLAWHYALDGYVGIAMSWLVWQLAGRLAHPAEWQRT